MKAENQISIGMNIMVNKNVRHFSFPALLTVQAERFESQRFAWMAMMIIFQSCLASIACMYIFQNKGGDFMFIACTMLAMGCNSLFIAQAPAKWCLIGFYLSVVINLIFIAINL